MSVAGAVWLSLVNRVWGADHVLLLAGLTEAWMSHVVAPAALLRQRANAVPFPATLTSIRLCWLPAPDRPTAEPKGPADAV